VIVAAAIAALLAGCGGSSGPTATTGESTTSLPDTSRQVGNFLPNPGFEQGLSDWAAYGQSHLGLSAKARHSGRVGLVLQAVTAQPYGVYDPGVIGYPGGGDRFVFSAWVRGTPTTIGKFVTLQVNGRMASGASTVLVVKYTRMTDAWVHPRVSFRTPGGFVAADAFVLLERSVAVGDSVYVDDLSLTMRR